MCLWSIKVNSGCLQCHSTCVFVLCLQMRMGGMQSRGTALNHPWSGPLKGKTSPSSQTATFLGTSLLLVSEARKRPGWGVLLCSLILTSLPHVSAFQPSSWASKWWAMVRTSPSPFEWTGETLASLQKTWCSRELAWECPCPWSRRAIPTQVRPLWNTSLGKVLFIVKCDVTRSGFFIWASPGFKVNVEEKLWGIRGLCKREPSLCPLYPCHLHCQTSRPISDLVTLAELCIVGGLNEEEMLSQPPQLSSQKLMGPLLSLQAPRSNRLPLEAYSYPFWISKAP